MTPERPGTARDPLDVGPLRQIGGRGASARYGLERPGTAAEQGRLVAFDMRTLVAEARERDFYRIAGKHQPVHRPKSHQHQVCEFDNNTWPCDTRKVLDYIDNTLAALRADNELLTFGARKLQEERDRLREALTELREAVRCVPYHRNPKGGPCGYPDEGHRAYSCPMCLAISEADAVLRPVPPDILAGLQGIRDRLDSRTLTPASGSEGGEGHG